MIFDPTRAARVRHHHQAAIALPVYLNLFKCWDRFLTGFFTPTLCKVLTRQLNGQRVTVDSIDIGLSGRETWVVRGFRVSSRKLQTSYSERLPPFASNGKAS